MNYDRLTDQAWKFKQLKNENYRHHGENKEKKAMKLWRMIPQYSRMTDRERAEYIQKCRVLRIDSVGDSRLIGILDHVSIKCGFSW